MAVTDNVNTGGRNVDGFEFVDIENGSIRGSVGPIDSVFWELEKEHRITKITCEKMSEEQLFEHEKYPYEEFYVVNEIKT